MQVRRPTYRQASKPRLGNLSQNRSRDWGKRSVSHSCIRRKWHFVRCDASARFNYNWNRYYDPTTAKYVTSDPIGLEAGINTYGYVGQNPGVYYDTEGFGKIGIFVRTVKGGWRKVTRKQAERRLEKKGDVKLSGTGRNKLGKRMAEKQFGKKTVKHDAHKEGQLPHYQHKNGSRGHIFLDNKILIPGATLGIDMFDNNALAGEAVNFFNPLSEFQDIVDIGSDINEAIEGITGQGAGEALFELIHGPDGPMHVPAYNGDCN